MATKYIDYLTEDSPIPGQLWACISFLSPEGLRNCSVRGIKIRGVYGTRQEADAQALALQKADSDYHVFVGEVGKWLPWDPDVNDVEDQVYQEKQLNQLAGEYKKNLANIKKVEQQRKADMLERAAREEQAKSMRPVDKERARLRNKLDAQKKKETIIDTNCQIEEGTNELKSVQTKIEEGESKIDDYDKKINKMQELYNKLNSK